METGKLSDEFQEELAETKRQLRESELRHRKEKLLADKVRS